MGRNRLIQQDDVIHISSKEVTSKLQERSNRRAIVDFIIDEGGKTTMKQINDHFGSECRSQIRSLIKAGWLITGNIELQRDVLKEEPKEQELCQ